MPEDTESPDAAADPTEPEAHDPQGLELARSVASAYGQTAGSRPVRRKRRKRPRSEPGPISGAHPDDRDPQRLDAAMDRMVAEYGWKADVAVHGVFARWPLIVGSEIAQHCHPIRIDDGQLYVEADSTAWATQMRMLAATVVRRMNEELGDGTVLRVKVTGPQAPSWAKGPRSVRDGRGPRDTYG